MLGMKVRTVGSGRSTRRWLRSLSLAGLAALAAGSSLTATSAQAAVSGKPVIATANGDEFAFKNVQGEIVVRSFTGGAWRNWYSISGREAIGKPQAVSLRAGHVDVFVRWNDGSIRHRYYDNGRWSVGWERLGLWQFNSDPAPIASSSDRIDVFARGTDNALGHIWYTSAGGWSGWEPLGGGPAGVGGQPSVVSWQAGHWDVFYRGNTDNKLYHTYWGGSSWSTHQPLGNWTMSSDPEAATWGNGHADVFAAGGDNALNHIYFNGGGWSGWEGLGGKIWGKPSAFSWTAGHMDVTARWFESGPDYGKVFHRWFNGQSWQAWSALGDWVVQDAPVAVSTGYGHADVFGTGSDGNLNHIWAGNGNWNGWGSLGNQPPFTTTGRLCAQQGAWQQGSFVGLSLGQNIERIVKDPFRRGVYDNLINCLKTFGGNTAPSLRILFPIDSFKTGQGQVHLDALKVLMDEARASRSGMPGAIAGNRIVISIMSHDYTNCSNGTVQVTTVRALNSCEYPSPSVYGQLFGEIKTKVEQTLGRSDNDIVFAPWNEPNYPDYTLYHAPAIGGYTDQQRIGAYRAGQYYAQAYTILNGNTARLRGGDFAKSHSVTDAQLIQAFNDGAGRGIPNWTFHPYGDATNNGVSTLFPDTTAFETAAASKGGTSTWLTELGNVTQVSANATPWQYGKALRDRQLTKATSAFLGGLTTIDTTNDSPFESALTDSLGRARPILCGLGAMTTDSASAPTICAGNPAYRG